MEQYLAGVDSIQRVLGAHFGPYPFPQLSLVEFPRPLAQRVGFNAAGLPGLVLGNDRMFDVPMEHLAAVYGHELSHMWFPHVVSLRGAEGRYLEESLAQFGAARVIEALRGSDAAERARRTSDDVYYGAEEYFKLVARGADAPLAALARGADSHQLAYSKGGLVWEMLAREVGADLFRRTLMGVTDRHRFGQITFAELLDEIETGAGRELDWFYDQWFRRAGAPEWTLSWRQRGATVRGTLVQPAPAYRASVELRLTGTRGETQMHRVEVRALRTGFAVPAAFRVRAVEVDPHYRLLRWSPEYRALVDSVVAAGRR
jgi:aminopeptidase N